MSTSKASKEFETVVAQIEKQMGNKGDPKLYLFGSSPVVFETIPFGIIQATVSTYGTLDEATGIGGVARGRITEIFGPESSGKSWLSMMLVAQAQKQGLTAAWLDAECSFVGSWAARWGVDLSKLVFGNDFDCGEECLMYLLAMCQKKVADIIVLDSVASLIPKAELEHRLDERTVGEAARMMSTALKQIMQACRQNNVTVIFVNQTREKVGVMFGNPETTPGGKALKFYSSMRIRTWRKKIETKTINNRKTPQRAISGAKVVKNRVGTPGVEADYAIEFNADSNNPLMQLVRKAIEFKLINKKRGETELFYGTVKDGEATGASDIQEMAEWLQINEKVEELRLAVLKYAADHNEKVDEVFGSTLPAIIIPEVPEDKGDSDPNPEGSDPEAEAAE